MSYRKQNRVKKLKGGVGLRRYRKQSAADIAKADREAAEKEAALKRNILRKRKIAAKAKADGTSADEAALALWTGKPVRRS